jgi:hypothetical protein
MHHKRKLNIGPLSKRYERKAEKVLKEAWNSAVWGEVII